MIELTGKISNPRILNGVIMRSASSGGSGATEIFWATYGVTTTDEIKAANAAGKIVAVSYDDAGETYILKLTYIGDDDTCDFAAIDTARRVALKVDPPGGSTESWGRLFNIDFPLPQDFGTPADLGTAERGISTDYARADHVHKKPTAGDIGAVAIDQGVAHAGEFCVVGSDGNITTQAMTNAETEAM